MRTHRIADPRPRGAPTQKLEWGSSAWAADSCLVEWSTLEREWLDPEPKNVQSPGRTWARRLQDVPLPVWLWLVSLATLALAAFG